MNRSPSTGSKDPSNEFKVNKYMIKHGFKWNITPGTPESPNPFNGLWVKDGNAFTQEQAIFIYKNFRKKWWQS